MIFNELFTDNFTRANGAIGAGYTGNAGAWAISGNTLVKTASTGTAPTNLIRPVGLPTTSDHVIVTVEMLPSGESIVSPTIFLKHDSGTRNYIAVECHPSYTLLIWNGGQIDFGFFYPTPTGAVGGPAFAGNTILSVEMHKNAVPSKTRFRLCAWNAAKPGLLLAMATYDALNSDFDARIPSSGTVAIGANSYDATAAVKAISVINVDTIMPTVGQFNPTAVTQSASPLQTLGPLQAEVELAKVPGDDGPGMWLYANAYGAGNPFPTYDGVTNSNAASVAGPSGSATTNTAFTLTNAQGLISYPLNGILDPNNGTVFAQFKGAWTSSASDGRILGITTAGGAAISIAKFSNLFQLQVTGCANFNVPLGGALADDTWHAIGIVYKNGSVCLLVDNMATFCPAMHAPLYTARFGGVAPFVIGMSYVGQGLYLLSDAGNGGNVNLACANATVYARAALLPGDDLAQAAAFYAAQEKATIMPTPAGAAKALSGNLLGVLHNGFSTQAQTLATGLINFYRTDHPHWVPMKTGAADGTHPTSGRGTSGEARAYDWSIVDRSIAQYFFQQVGGSADATLLLDIDYNIPLTGGQQTANSSQNNSSFLWELNDNGSVPNDNASYAVWAEDYVGHVRGLFTAAGKNPDSIYWGVWNEYRDPQYFNGSPAQFHALYGAITSRLRTAFGASIKLGGMEWAGITGTSRTDVVNALTYVAANNLPMDFVNFHEFSGSPTVLNDALTDMKGMCQSLLGKQPPILVSEWANGFQNGYGSSLTPWSQLHPNNSAWGAAYWTQMMGTMAKHGVAGSNYILFDEAFGFAIGNGAVNGTEVHATYNAMKLWRRIPAGAKVLATSVDSVRGLDTVAFKDTGTGKLYIVASRMRYRRDGDANTDTVLSFGSGFAGTVTGHYVIDRNHSNFFEAGADHAELETGDAVTVTNGNVTIGMQSRSVHLLEIEPAGSGLSFADIQAAVTAALTAQGYTDLRAAKLDNAAQVGTPMSLLPAERTAIANEIEAHIIDDTDSEKVLRAITDKIASVNPSLSGLTLAAIASAVKTSVEAAGGSLAAIKTKTDNLPTQPAAVGSEMALSSAARDLAADTLLDRAGGVETGLTPRQALRVFLAVLAGKATVSGNTVTFLRKDGQTAALSITGSETGARSNSTLGSV